ncbi:MAG: hypothetical protein RRY06_06715 [Lachnospiraceae bacterium]
MGDRSIKKETKKMKKSADKAVSSATKPIMTQPEVIKKVKKQK